MGAYLSAREAADYCGVSEKTIRNWLAAGKLSAEKSAGSFRISQDQLDALKREGPRTPRGADRQPEGSAEEVRAEGPQALTVQDVLGLLRDLQAELLARTEAATAWQVRAEVLAHQLAEAQGRIRALEAPKEPEPPPVPEPPAPAPDGQGDAPWWRRWWAWGLL
jgi:excisionase family DNA binding protein